MAASLATLDRRSGHPFVSLVQVASLAGGEPVFLISRLAQHTLNLAADPRASLLVDRRGRPGDALAVERATLVGQARPLEGEAGRARLLARHPAAEAYAAFADFGLWSLAIERAHLVGGFGRIGEVPGEEVVLREAETCAIAGDEAALITELNAEHFRIGQAHVGAPADARIIGLDCEGLDLSTAGTVVRLELDRPCASADELRSAVPAALRRWLGKDKPASP